MLLDIDTELDIVYNHIDELYYKQKFNEIDLILSQVNENLELTLLVSFLCVTIPHKEVFKHRDRIVGLVRQKKPVLLTGFI